VVAFSRSTAPSIELLDEASLKRATTFAADQGELRLVIDATGFLHDNRQGPEKSWRQLDAVNLARSSRKGVAVASGLSLALSIAWHCAQCSRARLNPRRVSGCARAGALNSNMTGVMNREYLEVKPIISCISRSINSPVSYSESRSTS
jgi:hypothetical protein